MNYFYKIFFIVLSGLSAQFVAAQISVSGVVSDAANGEPLIGVTVAVQGATTATMTDIDGKFQISVPQNGKLTFSFVGYRQQTVNINGRNFINISLEDDATILDEVVAIGYGTMKKSDLTGAIGSVGGDKLQKTPAASVTQALSGRVAGVSVNANSGQPGEVAEVRVRGIGTLNNSEPIYVVDGVITDNIAFLNPNDIVRTDVLKDASATAIYGSRGANGVIIVTTKQGESGDGKISLNAYWGFQNRWRKLDLMKRDEMATMENRLSTNAGEKIVFFNQGFDEWLKNYKIGSSYYPAFGTYDYANTETDWQDEVFNANALIQNYHLSFAGGTEKSNYAISAGYFTQEGTIIGSDYQRLTLRVNSASQIRKWLKIGENLSFITSTGRNALHNNVNAGASALSAALTMAPWDPVRYPEGTINNLFADISGQLAASANNSQGVNPYVFSNYFHRKDIYEHWVGNMYIEIKPVKQLVFRSSFALDMQNLRSRDFTDQFDVGAASEMQRKNNSLSRGMTRWSTFGLENTLTYSNIWNEKHNLTVMAGQTTEEYNTYSMGGSGAGILNPVESNWYLKQTTKDRSETTDGVGRTRMFSLLGRVFYSFADKYLITMNFRADGSSKFPRHTWGYFPSTSLAWRVSEEGFLKNISWLDNLKFRAGWGRIGNDRSAGGQDFVMTIHTNGPTFTGYVWGPNTGYQQTVDKNGASVLTFVNLDGKWETTEQIDLGVDFGFWKGKLNGTIDLFRRDTKDMLLPKEAPATVGNRYSPNVNVGVVRNTGIEITLSHNNKIGDFEYAVEGNASFIKNKLIALNGGSTVWSGSEKKSDLGLPLFTYWGFEYLGVYQTEDEAREHLYGYSEVQRPYHAGDAKYRDLNNDGMILDDDDMMALGSNFPWLTGGLNLSAAYKGIDLALFFQGVYGNEIWNSQRVRILEGNGKGSQMSVAMRDVYIDFSDDHKNALIANGLNLDDILNLHGTIPNPNGTFNTQNSSRFIENGAYLRLKNIELGYTLPNYMIKGAGISRLRVYVSASNLLTLTGYTGYDPEVGGGVDYGNYPQSRTVMCGINVDF
ncbi:MAG: TonB-dependent receptor [Prevotellaceae bacterium]|nr:TonB-dependent receptor [Prevotellaceae bacterium]